MDQLKLDMLKEEQLTGLIDLLKDIKYNLLYANRFKVTIGL